MGGRSTSDNFKRRFGDLERIELKLETKKASVVEEADRNKKMAEATTDILRSVIGREPTHDEIIGKVDISKTKKRKST